MTLYDHIKRDLLSGQSTASNLALRFGKTEKVVQATLERLNKDGLVHSFPIQNGKFTVWRLRPTLAVGKEDACSPASRAQSDTVAEKKRPARPRKSCKPTQKQ